MKRLAFITGVLALAAPLAATVATAQASTWVSDQAHSDVSFSVTHMGISKVRGSFGKVAATISYNETDITKSVVSATIDVTTVDTGQSARDNHLKTDAFFDVAKFPTATFSSTSVAKDGNNLKVTGNLTLHGVTKPVILDVEGPTGPVQGLDKKPHAGFSASTTISRTAFGIGANFPTAAVGDEVKLTLDLDVQKQ
jgi:polyisoprenoid-binding protein YceI